MTTELKEKQSVRLDVELPDLSESIADVIEDYEKQLEKVCPDFSVSFQEQIEAYVHIWLDTQLEIAKIIHNRRLAKSHA